MSVEGTWRFCILHDITGWHRMRDKPLTFHQWCRFLIWRSNGRPVKHPIFKLALQTTKSQGLAQAQGHATIGLAEFDPNVTVDEIRAAADDIELAKATISLSTRAMTMPATFQETSSRWHLSSGRCWPQTLSDLTSTMNDPICSTRGAKPSIMTTFFDECCVVTSAILT